MIALGVADAIVDLVETGSTLAANRLRILDEIGSYETVLCRTSDAATPNWPTAWCGGWKAWSSPAAIRCWNTTFLATS